MQQVSLFVSSVPANVTAGDIWERVAFRRWGVVQDIVLLPVKPNRYMGSEVRNVIVHMYDWFDRHAMDDVIQGKYLKLYYQSTAYWKAVRYDPAHNTPAAMVPPKPVTPYPQQQRQPQPTRQYHQQQQQHYMPQHIPQNMPPPRREQNYRRPDTTPDTRYAPRREQPRREEPRHDTRKTAEHKRVSRSETDRRSRGDVVEFDVDDIAFTMTKMTIHTEEPEPEAEPEFIPENISVASTNVSSISGDEEIEEEEDDDEYTYNDLDQADESEKPVKPDYGDIKMPTKRYRKPVRKIVARK
jgi:hypothetical protein